MPCIVISPLSLVWLVSHPEHTLLEKPSLVLFSQRSEEETVIESDKDQPLEATQDYLDFADKSLASLDALMKDGAVTPEVSAICYAMTRAQAKEASAPKAKKPTTVKSNGCKHGTPTKGTESFVGSPPPDPYSKWVGHQNNIEPPEGGKIVMYGRKGYPAKLKAVETKNFGVWCSLTDRTMV